MSDISSLVGFLVTNTPASIDLMGWGGTENASAGK
jgi:hypothetical protein